jgi:hypothetical protein
MSGQSAFALCATALSAPSAYVSAAADEWACCDTPSTSRERRSWLLASPPPPPPRDDGSAGGGGDARGGGKYTVTYITPPGAVTPAAYLCDFLGAPDGAAAAAAESPPEQAPRRTVSRETFTALISRAAGGEWCTLALDRTGSVDASSLPIADGAVFVLDDDDDEDDEDE